MMRKGRKPGVSLLVALAVSVSPALGEESDDSRIFRHAYDPYAMTSPEGVEKEYRRLKKSIKTFCKMTGVWHPLVRRREKACRADLMADAVRMMPRELAMAYEKRAERR